MEMNMDSIKRYYLILISSGILFLLIGIVVSSCRWELRKYLKEVNAERDSLHWIFYKAAYDYITTGNAYIEVNRGKEFTTLFNQDSTKVRLSETDAYITAYWREIKNNANYSTKDYPTEVLPLWDNKLETTQKKFIIHLKNDTPEYDYYGLPENVQVLKWADIEYKIVQFNL
jgi:hypothetical protein